MYDDDGGMKKWSREWWIRKKSLWNIGGRGIIFVWIVSSHKIFSLLTSL